MAAQAEELLTLKSSDKGELLLLGAPSNGIEIKSGPGPSDLQAGPQRPNSGSEEW